MRTAVYYSNSDVRVEDRPRPVAGAGELLVRVRASGICGSDVMEWYRRPRAPLVLGHEIAGTVEEVGDGIEAFRPGDRIVTTHHVPCNDCHYCRTGRHSVCETLLTTNFEPGGFAEFVRLPAIHVQRGTFSLPDSVSFDEGTFVEPLACVVRGQRLAGVNRGDSVAVLGSGISGILHVQLARSRGAERIIATDVHPYRLDTARRFGVDAALDARDDLVARVHEINGRGVDHVIVCTGARQALTQALSIVDRGGTILIFAPLPPDKPFPLLTNELWRRGITIVHSYAGPPDDMRAALDLIAAREIDVAGMITHRVSLAETGRGFELVADAGESLKVIVDPGR